ncbi:MAG: transporter suffix domain-containing protein [Myxococcales bacterium]|nr:transporter suffix domain-containing protein [Myxococcales bacterium]
MSEHRNQTAQDVLSAPQADVGSEKDPTTPRTPTSLEGDVVSASRATALDVVEMAEEVETSASSRALSASLPQDPNETTPSEESKELSASMRKLAWGMVLVSFVLYAALFLIPFLNLGARFKLVLFVVLFVASEITFWGGGWLLGKEVLQRSRAYLNPFHWWKKQDPPTSSSPPPRP